MCEIECALRVASRATRFDHPHLHAAFESSRHALRPISIGIGGNADVPMFMSRLPDLVDEFRLRSLYERAAAGDDVATRLLRGCLVEQSRYDALARAASTAPPEILGYPIVGRILASDQPGSPRANLATACEAWATKPSMEQKAEFFGRELWGYARLDEHTLKRHLGELFAAAIDNPVLVRELVTHCAARPYLYLEAVAGLAITSIENDEIRGVIRELKRYLLNVEGPVSALYALSSHLQASSPWDTNIRNLLFTARQQPRDPDNVAVACETFLHQGLYEADRCIEMLVLENYWKQLPKKKRLENVWKDMHRAALAFVEAARDEPFALDLLENAFDEVGSLNKEFMDLLDTSVGIPPQRIEALYRDKFSEQVWGDSAVSIETEPGCRDIVCGQTDFQNLLQHVLDNAHENSDGDEDMSTRLTFRPVEEHVPRVVLEISHDVPVDIPESPWVWGGLKEISKIITSASGVAPVIRSTKAAYEPFLIATFWAWPLR